MDDHGITRKRQLSQDSQDKPPRKRVEEPGERQAWNELLDEIPGIPREYTKTCAKWCTLLSDGSYTIDENIIRNGLHSDVRNDPQLLHDHISGYAISGSIWPLMFEHASEDDMESVWFRSIPYFEMLIADVGRGEREYRTLGQHRKWLVGVGVRDLYLVAWKGYAEEREKQVLDGMLTVMGQEVATATIHGMQASYCPTSRHKVLKFIEDLDSKIDEQLIPGFAQTIDDPRLFAVFVDPVELSYHSFENIVPLDRWFDSRGEEINLSLTAPTQPSPIHEVFTCRLQGSPVGLMKELSSLGLYTEPLNKESRGGQRFIFSSALLSRELTKAIRSSGILGHIANGSLASAFEFVNFVFRCNRFSPQDTRFTSHLDTPYYDSARSHVSKYTLIIYLSSGAGNPALRIDTVDLTEIKELTCVIFDQRLHHEGQPFLDSDKVFLRTELIFRDESLVHNSQIAPLFSTACYLTGQEVFGEELSKYAHDCFERANSLHWALEQEPQNASEPPLYLHKTFRNAQFITNGYDYYFNKGTSTSLDINVADCAMLAVLDYLNCKITTHPFQAQCETKIIRHKLSSTADVWPLFDPDNHEMPASSPALPRLLTQDIAPLIRTQPTQPFVQRRWYSGTPDPDDDPECDPPCCPFHCWQTFDAWKDPDMRKDYRKCWNYTRNQLFGSPLVILGQNIYINENQILVRDDKIYILADGAETLGTQQQPLPPLNFAACWVEYIPSVMITVEGEIRTPGLLIPPIIFHEYDDGWHLVLDLFRNDWMVRVEEDKSVALPVITNEFPEEGELLSFWDKVGVESDDAEELLDSDDDDWGSFVWSVVDDEGEGSRGDSSGEEEENGSEDDSEGDGSDIAESSDSSVTI